MTATTDPSARKRKLGVAGDGGSEVDHDYDNISGVEVSPTKRRSALSDRGIFANKLCMAKASINQILAEALQAMPSDEESRAQLEVWADEILEPVHAKLQERVASRYQARHNLSDLDASGREPSALAYVTAELGAIVLGGEQKPGATDAMRSRVSAGTAQLAEVFEVVKEACGGNLCKGKGKAPDNLPWPCVDTIMGLDCAAGYDQQWMARKQIEFQYRALQEDRARLQASPQQARKPLKMDQLRTLTSLLFSCFGRAGLEQAEQALQGQRQEEATDIELIEAAGRAAAAETDAVTKRRLTAWVAGLKADPKPPGELNAYSTVKQNLALVQAHRNTQEWLQGYRKGDPVYVKRLQPFLGGAANTRADTLLVRFDMHAIGLPAFRENIKNAEEKAKYERMATRRARTTATCKKWHLLYKHLGAVFMFLLGGGSRCKLDGMGAATLQRLLELFTKVCPEVVEMLLSAGPHLQEDFLAGQCHTLSLSTLEDLDQVRTALMCAYPAFCEEVTGGATAQAGAQLEDEDSDEESETEEMA